MIEELKRIEEEAAKEIAACPDPDMAERIRVKYLGRKGILTELLKKMKELPSDERPAVGKTANAVKISITARLDGQLENVIRKGASGRALRLRSGRANDEIDVTLPGTARAVGKPHPVQTIIREISDIFVSLGFRVVEGSEIESEHYNFEALNIPLEHPSRDAFDTFYISSGKEKIPRSTRDRYLLRSHTSPVQARFMEKNKPPFSIISPGKVFRPDATDASHSFMFHQVEGLTVAGHITFADLKGVLTIFSRQMFGEAIKMRFRPSFFPFTEPSAEMDISCIICGGSGCRVCSRNGWLEILGAGMVNPNVFKAAGYDPEKISGFAFGMGVERIAMLKYGIDDIRLFFENDTRFLRQF
ncbi:MAG: phenylalanine--tRNA ligase subunit alpha [Candidatus Omnitrophota bacterium]